MAYQEFVSLIHKSTKRDYLARVTERDKAAVAELAIQVRVRLLGRQPANRIWRLSL